VDARGGGGDTRGTIVTRAQLHVCIRSIAVPSLVRTGREGKKIAGTTTLDSTSHGNFSSREIPWTARGGSGEGEGASLCSSRAFAILN